MNFISDALGIIWSALQDELSSVFPDLRVWVHVVFRLLLALFVSSIVGWEREREKKAAGLRTHVLVALGAAIFMLLSSQNGAVGGELTRVVQGIAAGIGFIGGGVILKLEQDRTVKGLTTAASIWLAASLGAAAGAGQGAVAITGALLCWFVLASLHHIEKQMKSRWQMPIPPPREHD